MKNHLFLLATASLLLGACDRTTTADNNARRDATQDRREQLPPRADDTGRNVRDRNDRALTSGNQSESEADRTITQKIRQAVMDDDSLSTNAKNVKIITINGVVTLRGPVNNDREKGEIGRKAQATSGVRNVENFLEIIRVENASGRY